MKEITCIDCGKTFELNEADIRFFEDRGLTLPKRCEACRKQRREHREEVAQCIFCGNEFRVIPYRIKLNSILACADCKDVMLKASWHKNAGLYQKYIIGKKDFYHGTN